MDRVYVLPVCAHTASATAVFILYLLACPDVSGSPQLVHYLCSALF